MLSEVYFHYSYIYYSHRINKLLLKKIYMISRENLLLRFNISIMINAVNYFLLNGKLINNQNITNAKKIYI